MYFLLRPWLRTGIVTAAHIPLAKRSHMTKPNISKV